MSIFRRGRSPLSGAQASIDPHDWKLPSSYTFSPSKGGCRTVIPDPNVFSNAGTPRLGDTNVPDASHAAVHLALLECFRGLKLNATALDVPVELPPQYAEKPNLASAADPGSSTQNERWDLLLKLAVTRFGVWWSQIHLVLTHAAAYANHGGSTRQVQLTESYLPPLDVLLVWYAFMLDSSSYAAACRARESDVPGLANLCFPWKAIWTVVDMDTMVYTLPKGAQTLFHTLSGQSADILTYLNDPPAYTEEPLPLLPVDMVAEVKKHEPFLDEAHNLLWIRSPALQGSLKRASADFKGVKAQLTCATNADSAAELSFGVRLFWRTFRLFPFVYQALARNGGVPDYHENKPPSAHGKTPGEAPSPSHCTCWTCERIRDYLPHFTRTQASAPEKDTAAGSSAPSITQQVSSLSVQQLRQIQDDLGFYRAVEKARSSGLPLPSRPPTDAEKQKESLSKQRQKEVGYLPGINEYAEVQADGCTKIKRSKHANAWSGWWWL
ncbi:hypothetical protein LLEC1_03093 [Akanthomyces lecanii]|uniref:Uncharacterized protein n=1 Tax=Cordyceps confragosa TaxID=2714763 RepID=A0A179IHY4_CORDF|nr:hypothetical protein LLEC1_03093 [Akanthomyces lecanii]